MRRKFLIEVIDHPLKTVICPTTIHNFENVTRVAFGTNTIDHNFSIVQKEQSKIFISKDLANELKFPQLNLPLHVFVENDTMFIGPLVGIFTSGFTPFPMRPIGERSLFFAKLLSVKKSVAALPFVFGEEHINWEQGTIQALFYHDKGWESLEVPFPNVVYDRLPNRKSERKKALQQVKNRMQTDYLIPWYNPGFFNKLDVFERIQQESTVSHYLPETHPFTSFSMIERMLGEYGHVYLKPMNGSLGLGIHQILFDKHEEVYYCRYRNDQGNNKLRKFQTLESLMNQLFGQKSLKHMLVQQGIHLLRLNKRTIDFRIHTNKDENGKWKVTALAAKMAGAGSVTTHLNNGGEIKTIEEIFLAEQDQKSIKEKLTKSALELSHALEENMEGIIGEIGFDMGMDRQGNVWLFEANSKPGRSIFKHPQLKEFDGLTRRLSLAFAVFLAERAITRPEEMFK
ncbi:YheC/YheD family protein [Cytobacillus spongiae]|uniref:YheC/YheD family endospore coat-associated protein n=1 Tax=Cytobacillus spongiae TaxID=2901381 RepID=UPI001F300D1A|nr:YheC/YheD family protein [Cytobacillus spongiae]UII56854.1 YheC/YheD family protein [Cytobacillus spongiae]